LGNKLEDEINKAYYANEKYNVLATFAMVYHEKKISIKKMGKFLRSTDKFFHIDNNHYFIIFHYTIHDNAYKASQNLLLKLDEYFQNLSTSIAISSFNGTKSPTIVINRLKQIIEEVKKSSFTRIEDESILDSQI